MAFIDLAEKMGEVCKASPEPYYPTIYIDGRDLPFDKHDVGTIFKSEVMVKLKSITMESTSGKDTSRHTFEVRKIDFLKNKEQEDFTRGRVRRKKIATGG
jgi:hypothetical protein